MTSDRQDDSANATATLRLLPPHIAEPIRDCTDPGALRRFACACARRALTACRSEEPLLLEALRTALTLDAQAPDQVSGLRHAIAERVERLDELAFEAQEAWDRGAGSREAHVSAFRTARAATSVLRALEPYPALAAAEAYYEASHALDESQALDDVPIANVTAEDILTRKDE